MVEKNINLSKLCEEKLLNLRICDLGLDIDGTWLKDCIEELYKELDAKGIEFKPSCYLADEWLTPDGEPVVGIPFFLAHPVLMKLEKKIMLDVEGGTKSWCLKLLRHETGHAINYAYKLYRRKKWQKAFGQFSKEYPDTYRFRPYSRSFVRHLEDYYAQYHPDEDFAETFAVWLTPHFDWRLHYKGWKALGKLEYVDNLMSDIRNKPPFVNKGKKYWQASRIKIVLRNYYRKKKHYCAEEFPDFHDTNLKEIFAVSNGANADLPDAAGLIKKYRKNILDNISRWTGEKKYIVNDLIMTIASRCGDLKLVSSISESLAVIKISVYITMLVMNYTHTGRFKGNK